LKKILFFTSSRADYGILSGLIKKISVNKKFNLDVIVSGSHLDKKYGYSLKEILKDKIKIRKKIKITTTANNSLNTILASSETLLKFAKVLKKINPHLVILLGDRYETFSAAIASYILNIPIAHLHGGEVTVGSQDEGFRHSITKLSNYHFVTNKVYYNRVVQLGENPKSIFLVGSLASENLKRVKLKDKQELEKNMKFKLLKKNLLVTFHPFTIENDFGKKQLNVLLSFLSTLKQYRIIFTSSNADANSKYFKAQINLFLKKNNNSKYIGSLGRVNYYSLLNYIDCMIGNSSSGILESQHFKLPVINIGNRQNGRIMTKNIIQLQNNLSIVNLRSKLKIALSKNFKNKLNNLKDPNYIKNTSENMIKILLKINSRDNKLKTFYDIR